MITVHKQALTYGTPNVVSMPVGAHVLCVKEQHNVPMLYFRGDTVAPRQGRRFVCCMTGAECPSGETGTYIGTVLLDYGDFVIHVFEVTG